MAERIEVGRRYWWVGPDQRTKETRLHVVAVNNIAANGQIYARDEVGYVLPVLASDLRLIGDSVELSANADSA